jgi:hypothetical protein
VNGSNSSRGSGIASTRTKRRRSAEAAADPEAGRDWDQLKTDLKRRLAEGSRSGSAPSRTQEVAETISWYNRAVVTWTASKTQLGALNRAVDRAWLGFEAEAVHRGYGGPHDSAAGSAQHGSADGGGCDRGRGELCCVCSQPEADLIRKAAPTPLILA